MQTPDTIANPETMSQPMDTTNDELNGHDGDWIESEHITTEGIRLIQTGNIGVGCFVEKDARKFIYEASFNSLRCKQLTVGDLLICRLADPAGRACVLSAGSASRQMSRSPTVNCLHRSELKDAS